MISQFKLDHSKFDPVSFAFVMASGAVSIALDLMGWLLLSNFFLAIAVLGYISLIFLAVKHYLHAPAKFVKELSSIETLFKSLTFAAGTNSLAKRFLLIDENTLGLILGVIGIATTVILIYTIIYFLFFKTSSSIELISPYWLLLTIACHYCGIVTNALSTNLGLAQEPLLLLEFTFWTFGVVAYFMFMTLNMYRMFFLPFTGDDLNPAYWTCMGAAAIGVVDGSYLVLVKNPPAFLIAVKPFIQGTILILWCWATIWIPMLCLMGIAKYFYFKKPFDYSPSLWAVVFPLAMYAIASHYLLPAIYIPTIDPFVSILLWVAVGSWLVMASNKLKSFLKV